MALLPNRGISPGYPGVGWHFSAFEVLEVMGAVLGMDAVVSWDMAMSQCPLTFKKGWAGQLWPDRGRKSDILTQVPTWDLRLGYFCGIWRGDERLWYVRRPGPASVHIYEPAHHMYEVDNAGRPTKVSEEWETLKTEPLSVFEERVRWGDGGIGLGPKPEDEWGILLARALWGSWPGRAERF